MHTGAMGDVIVEWVARFIVARVTSSPLSLALQEVMKRAANLIAHCKELE